MRVVVTTESRFTRTPDGRVWSTTAQDHGFWSRYLNTFSSVRVVGRVLAVADAPADAKPVLGPGVEVWPVPHYRGPLQYLTRRASVARALVGSASPGDAVILRIPSPLGSVLAAHLERRGQPFGVQVVGDPHVVFAPGVVDHPLRPLLRWKYTRAQQRQCRQAVCASYVTQSYLQDRYPPAPGSPSFTESGAYLPPEAFVAGPRPAPPHPAHLRTISVGSLEQRYKGIDTVVCALAILTAHDRDVRHTHVGSGRHLAELQQLARSLGVENRIEFVGAVPSGAPVRQHLDAADLFLMPSRTEGLGRALVEAMARSLPAVASTVGGLPELLMPPHLIPPDSPTALAAAIARFQDDPAAMKAAGARNLESAREHTIDRLIIVREAFFGELAAATAVTTPVRIPT